MTGRDLAALAGQENVVIIRRPFVEWLGNIPDALLIDQILYWQNRAGVGEWWHLSDQEMGERLLLSKKAIAPSRDRLVALGFIRTERKGLPYRTFYMADLDKIAKAFGEHVASLGITSRPETDDRTSENGRHSIEGGVKGGQKVKALTPNPHGHDAPSTSTPLPPTLPAGQPGDQDATRTAPARAKGKASRAAAERPRDPAFDAFTGAFPTAAASLAAKFSKLVKGKAAPGDWDAWLRDVREDRAKGYVKAHNACELFLAWLDTRRGSPVTGSELEARMLRLGAPDNWRDIVYAPGGVRRSPVLALPRMGLEPYAQQGDWPAWYRAFEGVQP